VVVTTNGCSSAASAATGVTVNPIPPTPAINAGGPTTFCAGGSVTLTSSSASGNQWYLSGNAINGATGNTYNATASGNYTVVVTANGCSSAASAATAVTVNPSPATPNIFANGPTSFCTGSSVTLTSSSASGNQWLLNGAPIGGATNQTYVASTAGDYSVTVTASGCSSTSTVTTVTVNPRPNAAISVASPMTAGTSSTASVADAGSGTTYGWSITNGTINSGNGTRTIGFTAGAAGTLTLTVTVSTAAGCLDTKSVNVTVTSAAPPVVVSSVTPPVGRAVGGTNVTISGSGFQSGATVTFGGAAATNVVRVNATTITATTPAHAPGSVAVVVTNPDASSGTRNGGFTYVSQQFDPNNDGVIDPADIFYLVNYLFLSGPAPAGPAGMLSGDANGDGVVDPADIFYLVNYLFLSGPAPMSLPARPLSTTAAPLSGSIALGDAVVRNGRTFVPVIVTAAPGSSAPRALALRVRGEGLVAVRRAGAAKGVEPRFEITRRTPGVIAYLLSVGGDVLNGTVAEIEVTGGTAELEFDPALTMLTDERGVGKATTANGLLQLHGTALGRERVSPKSDHTEN
jgi:hypothetical protein